MYESLRSLDHKLARLTVYAPTALRAALGLVFVAHAYGKAAVFTFPGTEAVFIANGFPAWTVYPVFAAELLGGLALLAGFRVRAVALALLPVMFGAIVPHAGNGWLFSSNGGARLYSPDGSKPDGRSRWGHADLGGNVWEWTADTFRSPYAINPCNDCADRSSSNPGRAIRGGSLMHNEAALRTALRTDAVPNRRNFLQGARCARRP